MAIITSSGRILPATLLSVLRCEEEDRPCRALLYTRTKHRRDKFLQMAKKRFGSSVQIKLFGGAAKGRPSHRNDRLIEAEVEGGRADVVLLEDLDVMRQGDPEGFWIFLHTLHESWTHLVSLNGQFDSITRPLVWNRVCHSVGHGEWEGDWDELPEPLRSRVRPREAE